MRILSHSIRAVRLRVGDVVEVRSKEEILATLDDHGTLGNLPFMPEMLRFCGQRFEVLKRADKTCDTATQAGMRRLSNTVHLKELRCDGAAHGGCEAGCLIFWKEQWLRKVEVPPRTRVSPSRSEPDSRPHRRFVCTEEILYRSTRRSAPPSAPDSESCFSCQATCVPYFTDPLPWWDVRQYVRDLSSGNVTLGMFIYGLIVGAYEKFRNFRGHSPLHRLSGTRTRTPAETLDVNPGDFVRIKRTEEIRETLDPKGKNRGLTFTRDMIAFCGGEYPVLRRVHKIIDERTGKLISLAGGCLILEGVVCRGHLTRFCPRLTYQFWHDVWLSKIEQPAVCSDQPLQSLPKSEIPPDRPPHETGPQSQLAQ